MTIQFSTRILDEIKSKVAKNFHNFELMEACVMTAGVNVTFKTESGLKSIFVFWDEIL